MYSRKIDVVIQPAIDPLCEEINTNLGANPTSLINITKPVRRNTGHKKILSKKDGQKKMQSEKDSCSNAEVNAKIEAIFEEYTRKQNKVQSSVEDKESHKRRKIEEESPSVQEKGIRSESGENICPYCGKKFASETNLMNHIKTESCLCVPTKKQEQQYYIIESKTRTFPRTDKKSNLGSNFKKLLPMPPKPKNDVKKRTILNPRKEKRSNVRRLRSKQSDSTNNDVEKRTINPGKRKTSNVEKLEPKPTNNIIEEQTASNLSPIQAEDQIFLTSTECSVKGCGKSITSSTNLSNHLIYDHDINIKLEKLTFQSQWGFQKWRLETEDDTSCKYKMAQTSKPTVKFYNCCEVQKEDKSSKRICPSRMEVLEAEKNHITVLFYKTHLGHRQKDAVVLSKDFINKVAGSLKQGNSVVKILEDIKEKKITWENCQNINRITQEHIILIAKDHKISLDSAQPAPLILQSVAMPNETQQIHATPLILQSVSKPISSQVQTSANLQVVHNTLPFIVQSTVPAVAPLLIQSNLSNKIGLVVQKTNKITDEIITLSDVEEDSIRSELPKKNRKVSSEEENVRKKIHELSELLDKGISKDKCLSVEKCLNLALNVLRNDRKVVLYNELKKS